MPAETEEDTEGENEEKVRCRAGRTQPDNQQKDGGNDKPACVSPIFTAMNSTDVSQ